MSLRVENQNYHKPDDQKKIDTEKASLDSSRLDFEAQMRSGDTKKDWKSWDGYKPEYDQFGDKVKIEETDDTIKAEVDDSSVPPEKKGILDEFVSWFKAGVEKFAKETSKMKGYMIWVRRIVNPASAGSNPGASNLTSGPAKTMPSRLIALMKTVASVSIFEAKSHAAEGPSFSIF